MLALTSSTETPYHRWPAGPKLAAVSVAVFVLYLVDSPVLLALALLARLKNGFAIAHTAAAHIAASDLTHSVALQGSDEIGRLCSDMETMRGNLAEVVGRFKAGTGAIAGASTQVDAGALDLSSRTEQQASALEETASATEQLSGTV